MKDEVICSIGNFTIKKASSRTRGENFKKYDQYYVSVTEGHGYLHRDGLVSRYCGSQGWCKTFAKALKSVAKYHKLNNVNP